MKTVTRGGSDPTWWRRSKTYLARLDEAMVPQALNVPGYRLHPLKGAMNGYWSVTVRANWRILFRFEGNHAIDVELIDYH
jgi:toxin HigB-1